MRRIKTCGPSRAKPREADRREATNVFPSPRGTRGQQANEVWEMPARFDIHLVALDPVVGHEIRKNAARPGGFPGRDERAPRHRHHRPHDHERDPVSHPRSLPLPGQIGPHRARPIADRGHRTAGPAPGRTRPGHPGDSPAGPERDVRGVASTLRRPRAEGINTPLAGSHTNPPSTAGRESTLGDGGRSVLSMSCARERSQSLTSSATGASFPQKLICQASGEV